MSKPDIPPPSPPPQEVKQPVMNTRRRKGDSASMMGSTLLTSPSGVARNTVSTGGSTLLGG